MNILAYVHLRNIHGSTGAGRVARHLTEELARGKKDKLEILADPADHQRIIPRVGPPWSEFNYRFFRHETSRQQALWALFNRPAAETFWPEAEIVYCTAESYVPVQRAKLVVTLHDAAFFEDAAHRRSVAFWKQSLKWKYLYSILSRKAHLFHTVSQFSADRISHFFPAMKSRLRVVHNGVPSRFFAPVSAEGEEALRQIGLADRPFILLPRGLHYRKNADLVIEAWPVLRERHPELLLVVSSHCDPIYAARAQALGSSVQFTGFVSDELLCSMYHAARLVWFPSRYEGFGMPVLEAMACGTPVVASNIASLSEIAGAAAVLVDPLSAAAHIDAITMLLSDDNQREKLRHKGRSCAAEFTWEAAATRLRTEFETLL